MYTKGKVEDENGCGILEATINHVDKNDQVWFSKVVVYGNSLEEVNEITTRIVDELNGTDVGEQVPDYAAAFNMWQDDFINNPQAYEDSQTVAIRHLTEKLNGEEPSYGQIAAQMLIEYLEKVK